MEGLLPKWLRNWLARLLPSNHSSGDGAVHISRLHGNVTTITNNIQQVVDTSGLRDELGLARLPPCLSTKQLNKWRGT